MREESGDDSRYSDVLELLVGVYRVWDRVFELPRVEACYTLVGESSQYNTKRATRRNSPNSHPSTPKTRSPNLYPTAPRSRSPSRRVHRDPPATTPAPQSLESHLTDPPGGTPTSSRAQRCTCPIVDPPSATAVPQPPRGQSPRSTRTNARPKPCSSRTRRRPSSPASGGWGWPRTPRGSRSAASRPIRDGGRRTARDTPPRCSPSRRVRPWRG